MQLLDNVLWHALTGAQACYAAGANGARRYARGFSPLAGFANTEHPDLKSLAPFFDPEEHFYCDGWGGRAPRGWRVLHETTMYKMVWDAPVPDRDEATDAVPLGAADAQQALDLALLTKPGPFGPRTIELGDYFGYYENEQLVAMAGERMAAGTLREISGVCTHPDFRARGFARRLMLKLVRRQMGRGETPFLHVMRDNANALGLYRDMGFRVYRESVVRLVTRD
jgi:ribosomal protein S18 acetylase RimI-like enzyme